MIFADLEYEGKYWDHHDALVALIKEHFTQVQSGHQGDSWIWVLDGGEKVEIDSFYSMKHQVKSSKKGPHVQKVLDVLASKYELRLLAEPELEAHEDGPPST